MHDNVPPKPKPTVNCQPPMETEAGSAGPVRGGRSERLMSIQHTCKAGVIDPCKP